MPTTVRFRRTALVTASLVTLGVVGTGVLAQGSDTPVAARSGGSLSAAGAQVSSGLRPSTLDDRQLNTTRSVERVPLTAERTPPAKESRKLWTTAPLDLRIQPREKAIVADTVKARQQLQVTGNREAGFAQVVDGSTTRWVKASYLSVDKPKPPKPPKPTTGPDAGLSDAPCPDGSAIESALQPQSVKVYRAVCAAFPELTTYGGQDGHGEHVNGEAIDFMVPDHATGERVKDFVFAHRSELDLFDIIWAQHIWTIERSGEGFRSMSDRGSETANHYDHVHIKIN